MGQPEHLSLLGESYVYEWLKNDPCAPFHSAYICHACGFKKIYKSLLFRHFNVTGTHLSPQVIALVDNKVPTK